MIKNERAEIIPEKCVLCGHCLQVCPQSAKTLVSDLDKVQYMIHRGETVIASIAPSYMGLLNYNSLGQVNAALKMCIRDRSQAYEKLFSREEYQQGVTDDAMVLEAMTSHKVKLIEGSYFNIKVTTPEDMAVAEALLKFMSCSKK